MKRKKLLYIVANSKPELLSTCQRGAKLFIQCFLEKNPEYEVEIIRLFDCDLPEPTHVHFASRAELVSGEAYEALSREDQEVVQKMQQLCQQFKSADRYVIAAPMWTLAMPYKLKQYLDCIILNELTISISPKGVKGLLRHKVRKAIYIQSSAAIYPFTTINIPLLTQRVNHGVTYIYDVFRFLGIQCIHPLLIEGTEIDDIGVELALAEAGCEIKALCESFR